MAMERNQQVPPSCGASMAYPSMVPSATVTTVNMRQSLPAGEASLFYTPNHPTTQSRPSSSLNKRGAVNDNSIVPSKSNCIPPLRTAVECFHQDAQLCEKLKHRKGRWCKEEEEYADFLMDEFDAGMSLNVEQGSTLRAYLSRRLFCSPMRISKKFAGKRVGTLVYRCKHTGVQNYESLPQVTQMRQRSLELEFKFIQAFMRGEKERSERKRNEKKATLKLPFLAQTFPPAVVHPFSQNIHVGQTPHVLFGGIVQGPSQPIMPQANTVSAKTSILNHVELVESTTAQTDGMSNLSIHGRRPNALPRPKNGSCDTYPNQNTQIFTKLSVTFKDDPSLHHPGLMPPICMHPTSFKSRHIARNSASSFTSMPAISTQNSGSDIDIPDLVSGFDKHAATVKPISTEDIADVLESRPMCTSWPEDSKFFAGNIGHESPYITSKSFDELHFFGSSLDLNNSHDSNDSPAVSACKIGLGNPIVAITTDPNKSKSSAIRELILADHSASINPSQDIVLPPNGAFPLCTYPAISVPSQILGESVNTHLPVPPPQHELQMYNAQFLGQSHCYEFSNFPQNGKIGTFTEYHGASVPKVDGTVSSYQSGNCNVHNFPSNHSRGHSVESTEEPKKRHHLGTDHSSPFDCFHQLPYDAERKRLKTSHDASFSHAVSASEHSSDAGFDSDPVSSTE